MTQHTPGPWKFRAISDDRAGIVIALALETERRPVPLNDPCIMNVRDDWISYLLRSKLGQANARLIEAAPDLAHTLRALLDWAREHTSPRDDNSPHLLLIDAAAVLAKVDGATEENTR